MALFDEAVGNVAALDESPEHNFVRKHWLAETAQLESQGHSAAAAARLASYRVFSSKPGAYGTGLMQMIESGDWHASGDLAELAVNSGGWAYGTQNPDGIEATDAFRRRLAATSLVLHTQDTANRTCSIRARCSSIRAGSSLRSQRTPRPHLVRISVTHRSRRIQRYAPSRGRHCVCIAPES